MIVAVALAAAQTPEADALRAAAVEQLSALSLPDAPPLYHLRYRLQSLDIVEVVASFGAIVRSQSNVQRILGVEARVGSPAFDNTGFGGWEDGMASTALPLELDPLGVRRGVWRVTDGAYKQAVEHFARKSAQWLPPPDHPGDYVLTGPVVADDGTGAPHEAAALETLARQLSAAFVGGSDVEVGLIELGAEAGDEWIVDTEGTAVRRPLQELTMRATVALRAADGTRAADDLLWTVRSAEALPSLEDLTAQIQALQTRVRRIAEAPVLDQEYVGPVVFEGDAALDLFRWLLVPQFEGTPPPRAFDTWLGEIGGGASSVRLGRRVLPPGWEAVDDPTARAWHPSHMLHDAEGTPATPVELVQDGIVRNLLMTRIPRPGLATNGHARGYAGSVAHARATALEVRPADAGSMRALHRVAERTARGVGLDRYLVVRSLTEPALADVVDGLPLDEAVLPPPVDAAWRFEDGHEEPVRGLAFASAHRLHLRDLRAAGPQNEGSFLAAFGPGDRMSSGTGGLSTWLSAPDVLLGEMEVVPVATDPGDPPVFPLPSP